MKTWEHKQSLFVDLTLFTFKRGYYPWISLLKLSPEVYEIHSGDIIQFGVDVVECNRKVTHGCIIAIVRLYLPDGVMVKANPCIADEETHVPLGDLYKLNQYLQEANKREQCLESKLDVLQHVVEEAKRATEESWQAYVGEERDGNVGGIIGHSVLALREHEFRIAEIMRIWAFSMFRVTDVCSIEVLAMGGFGEWEMEFLTIMAVPPPQLLGRSFR
ncbi:hypothetical protein HUJ05_009728 [Dendroctonus ponderosae]|nr:hypothetical protein HUJ05_009728 [Dendroctonus ponderosae]